MDVSLSDDDVKTQLKHSNKKVEHLTQEIHVLKTNLNTKIALEDDYKLEIESQSKELLARDKKHAEDMAKVKATIRQEFKKKEQELEAMLEEKSKSCVQLEEKLAELQSSTTLPPSVEMEKDLSALRSELSDCRQELESVNHVRLDLLERSSSFAKQFNALNQELEQIKGLLDHTKQKCDQYKEENTNVKEEKERLEEDVQSMQFEILNLKNQAKATKDEAENATAKGNSLFSEVEDNRKAAMYKLKSAADETSHAKFQLSRANIELNRLRLENFNLHEAFQSIKKIDLPYLDGELKRRNEELIDDMRTTIEKQQQKLTVLASQNLPGPVDQFQWLQTKQSMHQKELNELSGKCHEMQMQLIVNETTKINTLRQERRTIADNIKLMSQVSELKAKLEELQAEDSKVEQSNVFNSESVNSDIENQPPEIASRPACLRMSAQTNLSRFAVPLSGFEYKVPDKPKRQPVTAPTIRVPPPPRPTPKSDS